MKDNPYIGPRPYARNDRYFYGRNRETRDLSALILSAREVLFYAQSGAGKTSLLNAQVIPHLEKNGFFVFPIARVGGDAPADLNSTVMQWANIFIYSALLGLDGGLTSPEQLIDHTLVSYLQMRLSTLPGEESLSPLLVFDQFEELFTTHSDQWNQRRGFFEQVAAALQAFPALGIVLAMREDYVAEVDPYVTLLPGGLAARFRMERLQEKGALDAICKPAEEAGCPFDREAAQNLVDNLRRVKKQAAVRPAESGETAAALGQYIEPVQLQVICRRLWDQLPEREGEPIHWSEVEQYGHPDQALLDFYEYGLALVYSQVGVSEKVLRRWFGEQLITSMGTRGLVLCGPESTAGLPNAAVDILEDAHIIRAESRAGAYWYELAHDRLVDPILESNRKWKKRLQTPLRLTAQQWQKSGDASLLYRGASLHEGQKWVASHPEEAEPYEVEFLTAGAAAEKMRRRNRHVRYGLTILFSLFVLGGLGWAWQTARATRDTYITEMVTRSKYYQETDREYSLRLAREALLRQNRSPFDRVLDPLLGSPDTIEAQNWLRQTLIDFYYVSSLKGLDADVAGFCYGPDEKTLYWVQSDGQVKMWSGDEEREAVSLMDIDLSGRNVLRVVACSPDHHQMAVGGDDGQHGQLGVFDLDQMEWSGWYGTEAQSPTIESITSAVFDPGGKWIALGFSVGPAIANVNNETNQGMIEVFDTTRYHSQLFIPTSHTVNNLAVSPDGEYLVASSNDREVYIWKLAPASIGEGIQVDLFNTISPHTEMVKALAFSPDGEYLALGSRDAVIRIYRAETGVPILILSDHDSEISALAFSPDGEYLASGSRDATVRLWHFAARNPWAVTVLNEPEGNVSSLAFSMRDGMGLVLSAVSEDPAIFQWDLAASLKTPLTTLTGHSSWSLAVATSPDSRHLATADDQGNVFIWDVGLGAEGISHTVEGGAIWDLEYSLDGRYLVSSSDAGSIEIWDAVNSTRVTTLTGHTMSANMTAFDPVTSHHRMLSAGDDKQLILWDTQSWTAITTSLGVTATEAIYAVTYSPDGKWVASGDSDGMVRVWQILEGETGPYFSLVRSWAAHTDALMGLAFDPTGRYLASGSWDNKVILWDVQNDFAQVAQLMHDSDVYSLAFDPLDPRALVVGVGSGKVYLWGVKNAVAKAGLNEVPEPFSVMNSSSEAIRGVQFTPDGRFLVALTWNGNLRRYFSSTAEVLEVSWQLVPDDRDFNP